GYVINLIQIDTQMQKVVKIRDRSELPKMSIKGHGGTELQEAIDHILNPVNKLRRFGTVMLTDGYVGTLDFKFSPNQFLVLTTEAMPQCVNTSTNVKVIKIEK